MREKDLKIANEILERWVMKDDDDDNSLDCILDAMREYARQFLDYAAEQVFAHNRVNPLSNKETILKVKELIK